jgi:hypothetical protein
MKKRIGPITAGALMKQLQADRGFQARLQKEDRARERYLARLSEAEAPLLAALADCGVHVRSVWDLVNTSSHYETAIPILLRHLQEPYADKIKEGIARALAIRPAHIGWRTLAAEYRKTPSANNGVKVGLAAALAATTTDATIRELIEFLNDPSHGESRVLLLKALRRSKNPAARQALEQLSTDPELHKEITSWRRHRK